MTDESTDQRLDLLSLCTEAKRLGRARKESGRARFLVEGPDLWIAAVSNYNVVLDLPARRLQHGCRDFMGQAPDRKICKHVAALLLAIDEPTAIQVLESLTDPRGDWHLEVIASRGFAGPR